MAKLPKANIDWRKIKPGMCVTQVGHAYVVQVDKKRKAVAFWGSQDARDAQDFLEMRRRSRAFCKTDLKGSRRR